MSEASSPNIVSDPLLETKTTSQIQLGTFPQSLERVRTLSFHVRKVAAFEVPFDSESESNPQCLRRRVFPASTTGWTKNCVVKAQQNLPDFLFTDLSFLNEKGWLTRDISYEDLGVTGGRADLFYGRPPQHAREKDLRYVQVITRNSYYYMLLWALLRSGVVFMVAEYTNATFYKTAMDRFREHSEKPKVQFLGSLYMCIFGVFLIVRITVALCFAKREWDENYASDIVRKGFIERLPPFQFEQQRGNITCREMPLNRFERSRAFLALACLQLLGVRGIIRDLPVFLHPWKGLQPYAAFKADGVRAYMLGFHNRALFQVEDEPNFMPLYILALVQALLLSSIKLYIRSIENLGGATLFFLDLAPGLVTIIVSGYEAYNLWHAKKEVKDWLADMRKSSNVGQQQVAEKLWNKHVKGVEGIIAAPLGRLAARRPVNEQSVRPAPLNRTQTDEARAQVKKSCLERCAELARELEQLQVCERFEADLIMLGVKIEEAGKFLTSVRNIARREAETLGYSAYSRLRGPKIAYMIKKRAKVIGYVGSPGNLKDEAVSNVLHALVTRMQQMGHQVYVGPPNSALAHDGVQIQDMNEADVNMFDMVLITPGGPGAQTEARRFKGHAVFLTFVNTADKKFGSPAWMAELEAHKNFDFQAMCDIECVMEAVNQ